MLRGCLDSLKNIVVPREEEIPSRLPALLVSPSKTWKN